MLSMFKKIMQRPPNFMIGGKDHPYLKRWWVIPRNHVFNIYLHQILRDDDDRALHDHPWFNLSIILDGRYNEHGIKAGGIHTIKLRKSGNIIFRSPWLAHRLALIDAAPCVSLFITGPSIRSWGFHCKRGWVHWKEFVNPNDKGLIGPGCGDA